MSGRRQKICPPIFWNGVTGRKFPSVLTKAHRVLKFRRVWPLRGRPASLASSVGIRSAHYTDLPSQHTRALRSRAAAPRPHVHVGRSGSTCKTRTRPKYHTCPNHSRTTARDPPLLTTVPSSLPPHDVGDPRERGRGRGRGRDGRARALCPHTYPTVSPSYPTRGRSLYLAQPTDAAAHFCRNAG